MFKNTKMTKVQCDISVCFLLILSGIVIKFSNGSPEINKIDLHSFDFEQFKHYLFGNNPISDENISSTDLECSNELQEIKNGLKNVEPWAITCNPDSI